VAFLLGLPLADGVAAPTSAPAGDPKTASVFRWAAEGDAMSMDPYTRDETQQLSLLGNIYEPLIRHDPKMRLEPALAESWEQVSPDVWRFHLRPGVRWQDDTPPPTTCCFP
jgi:peptide/nickel transport system substrate-binding protein